MVDPELREQLGEAAREVALHYRESAAVTNLADRLLRVIQSTL